MSSDPVLDLLGLMVEDDRARRPSVFECIAVVSSILEIHKLNLDLLKNAKNSPNQPKLAYFRQKEFSNDPGPVEFQTVGSLEEFKESASCLHAASPGMSFSEQARGGLLEDTPKSGSKSPVLGISLQNARKRGSPLGTDSSHQKSAISGRIQLYGVPKDLAPASLVIDSPNQRSPKGTSPNSLLAAKRVKLAKQSTKTKMDKAETHKLPGLKLNGIGRQSRPSNFLVSSKPILLDVRATDLHEDEPSHLHTNLQPCEILLQTPGEIRNPFLLGKVNRVLGAGMKPSSVRVVALQKPEVEPPVE